MVNSSIISKGLREQKINQTQIDCTSNFHQSHRKAIEHNYSKSTYFTSTYPELMPLINNNQQILTELTIPLINFIKQYLEISTKIVFSSQLSCSGKKADLLAIFAKKLTQTCIFLRQVHVIILKTRLLSQIV